MASETADKASGGIAGRVRSLLEKVVARAGIELLDVEYHRGARGMLLRLTIDKPGGVTVDDCADVSRLAGDILDVKDPVPGKYRLEVSSPGINRPLKRREDFEQYAGQKVFIETREPLEGRKRFRGVLRGVQQGQIVVALDRTTVEIPLSQISKARLNII